MRARIGDGGETIYVVGMLRRWLVSRRWFGSGGFHVRFLLCFSRRAVLDENADSYSEAQHVRSTLRVMTMRRNWRARQTEQ